MSTAILGEDILALPSKHPDMYKFSLQANRNFLNELTVLRGQKASLAKTKSEEITFDMSCVVRKASRLPTQDWKTGLRFPVFRRLLIYSTSILLPTKQPDLRVTDIVVL
jgi:hypothetical protein